MSNIKKTLITVIIAIIAILGIKNISSAYEVGQVLKINGAAYNNNPDLFCLEREQKFTGTMEFKVVSQVKIEGDTSTDYKGKTVKDLANARFRIHIITRQWTT